MSEIAGVVINIHVTLGRCILRRDFSREEVTQS